MAKLENIDRDALIALIDALSDETITEVQMATLEVMLVKSSEARKFYHMQMGIHRDLEAGLVPEETREGNVVHLNFRRLISVAAAITILATGFGWWMLRVEQSQSIGDVASVTALTDVVWPDGSSGLAEGEALTVGSRVEFSGGLLQLNFASGVIASLEGPAKFELTDEEVVFLHRGKIAAYVPEGAEGFRVVTNSAEITDLGTEFAVDASSDGETQLFVFDGEVDLVSGSTSRRIEAGNAFTIDGAGNAERANFSSGAFDRARVDLRNHRLIWDAFRMGEPFPGYRSGGWSGPWHLKTVGGNLDKEITGVREGKELVEGSESFLRVAAKSRARGPLTVSLAREFESTSTVRIDKPYSTEFFVRLATPGRLVVSGSPGWEIDTSDLSLKPGVAYRFAIAVHPQQRTWRAIMTEPQSGRESEHRFDGTLDNVTLPGHASLQLDVSTHQQSIDLRFSLDAVRVWNFPSNQR